MPHPTPHPTPRLEGKIALVTGAARGIGAAIARRFCAEGATVVINDLDRVGAEKLAAELGGGCLALAADVSDSDAVRAMFAQVEERFGGLDILVNNAGISGVEQDPARIQEAVDIAQQQMMATMQGLEPEVHNDVTMNMSDDEWRRMLAVHLDGTFYCSREALKLMLERPGACVINMGSIMGTAGGGGAAAYGAAKAGILGFTRSLAREVASRRIRVNAIAPGWIDTDMTAPMEAMHGALRAQTPLGRLGDVDDIAWAAVYLASEEAKFMTGQVISPNGGWTMNQ